MGYFRYIISPVTPLIRYRRPPRDRTASTEKNTISIIPASNPSWTTIDPSVRRHQGRSKGTQYCVLTGFALNIWLLWFQCVQLEELYRNNCILHRFHILYNSCACPKMLNAFVAVIFKNCCYRCLGHDGKVHLLLCSPLTSVKYVIPWLGTMFFQNHNFGQTHFGPNTMN